MKLDDVDIKVFTEDQIKELFKQSILDVDPFTYMFFLIGLNTAMRHMEILSLHTKHIRFDKCEFYIPEAKAGWRNQPFPQSIVEPLKRHIGMLSDPSGFVFPAKSATGHRTYMKKQFKRTVKRAGLCSKTYTPHSMRHTVITRCVEQGMSNELIRKISGHKSDRMIQRYSHPSPKAIQESVNSISIV